LQKIAIVTAYVLAGAFRLSLTHLILHYKERHFLHNPPITSGMIRGKSDSQNPDARQGGRLGLPLLGIVCALVILLFGWISQSALLSLRPQPEKTFYNLLVQGFSAGQLNVITRPPPELAHMANPYVPASFEPYGADLYDLSYYHGKLYLYWGITPVLVLYWPYTALTGDYLSDADAIMVFLPLGFLVAAGMLNAIRRRYFPDIPAWLVLVSILTLGLTLAAQEMEWQFCAVHEVALSSGFAFSMLALAALWRALHQPKRQILCVLLASLAYGLAIGSRPSLVFGAIILLLPMMQAWRAKGSPGRLASISAAAIVPVTLIIAGLMLYNQLRFGNPFEFGMRYQLNTDRFGPSQRFGLRYLISNFYFYFLEPMKWARYFPFVQPIPGITLPSGYSPVGKFYGGILLTLPLVWLALAAPLAWRGEPTGPRASLRWFVAAIFLLFITGAVMICLFADAFTRYALDFLPELVLLSFLGIFALECAFRDSPSRRKVRVGWGLLLVWSVVLNLLTGIAALADVYGFSATIMAGQGQPGNAIPYFQKALALEPGSAQLHFALGSAYHQTGWDEQAVAEFQKALELDPALPQAAQMRENLADYFSGAGRLNEAIAQYQKVLEINSDNAAVQYDLGRAFYKTGRSGEAIPHLQKALELQPSLAVNENASDNNDLAWSLATSPDPGQRNGPLAVKLAEAACKMTDYRETVMVGTLAAAHGEAGQFDDAISTAQKAITLAKENHQPDLLRTNQQLLALYLKHQPYHAGTTNSSTPP
jgi:tetratricopeptide (TPR) repeat protein